MSTHEGNESLCLRQQWSGLTEIHRPIVGEWVVKLLEDGKQPLPRWQWRHIQKGKGGKEWGDAVSWRIGTTREIEEVIEEQNRAVKARL